MDALYQLSYRGASTKEGQTPPLVIKVNLITSLLPLKLASLVLRDLLEYFGILAYPSLLANTYDCGIMGQVPL